MNTIVKLWKFGITAGLAVVCLCGMAPLSAAPAAPGDDQVQPSIAISVGGTACTLGFVLVSPDGLAQGLTAAHCGKVGSTVTAGTAPIGAISARVPGADVARMQIATALPVYADVATIGRVADTLGRADLNEMRPLLCKRGAGSALTCGPMLGSASATSVDFAARVTDADAGAPVYALTRQGAVMAVGIVIGAGSVDGSATAALVVPVMSRWKLAVVQ